MAKNGNILSLGPALQSQLGTAPMPAMPPIVAQVQPTALMVATFMAQCHRSMRPEATPREVATLALDDATALCEEYGARVQLRQNLQGH